MTVKMKDEPAFWCPRILYNDGICGGHYAEEVKEGAIFPAPVLPHPFLLIQVHPMNQSMT